MCSVFRYFVAVFLLVFSVFCLPPAVQAAEENPSVPMLSGGVGEEEYEALQTAKDRFNTRMLFTETSGAYLSDVKVDISQGDGAVIASTTTQGPVLFVKLKPGTYSVKAVVGGLTKEHKFTVSGKGMTQVHLAFPLRNSGD